MFRDKMKLLTSVVLALSFLMGELSLSVPGIAFASNQAAKPVASVPSTTARWVSCNVDGDFDADDWCWVKGNQNVFGNGPYFLGNGMYVFRNGRYVLRKKNLIHNGYIMHNGQIIGYTNNFGNPIYYP
jgi:hypothetical protein